MAFRHAGDGDKAGLWEITARIVAETERALLVDDGQGPRWLPRRFLKLERLKDELALVAMPEWLAKEKGYV